MTHHRLQVPVVLTGVVGLILGIGIGGTWQSAPLQAVQATRRAIRPAQAPNTGLPFSPGVLVGSTLYISGHLGRDPVTATTGPEAVR